MTNVDSQNVPAIFRITAKGEGLVISNFALQHLIAAITFRDKVISLEEEHEKKELSDFFTEIRSYSSACLMSSVAALEALINELFIYPGGKLYPLFNDFEEEFWNQKKSIERKPILKKYQLALEMVDADRIDENSLEYKDADSLIKLRNALIHFKPTWDSKHQRVVQLKESLKGRFQTSPFVDEGADFVSVQSMSAGCVKWAVASTLSFMFKFEERAKLEPKKMVAFWRLT